MNPANSLIEEDMWWFILFWGFPCSTPLSSEYSNIGPKSDTFGICSFFFYCSQFCYKKKEQGHHVATLRLPFWKRLCVFVRVWKMPTCRCKSIHMFRHNHHLNTQSHRFVKTLAARHNSRGEGRIVLGSQVVWVQVEHANHEGHKHHDEDDHEFEDIFDCAPQWDLQWAEALVGWQDVGDAWEAQHHSDGVQAFWDDLGVWGAPLVPGWRNRKIKTGGWVRFWRIIWMSYCWVKPEIVV